MILDIIVAILALAGLADATYLTLQHYTGASLACGGSASCSEVLGSRFANFQGYPVAAFGAIGYFAVFSFAILAAFRYAGVRNLLRLTVAVMFAAALWFLYVQAFILHAFCPYCLFSAGLTIVITGLTIASPPNR